MPILSHTSSERPSSHSEISPGWELCDKKHLTYPGKQDTYLSSEPVDIMIGGQAISGPFYPPEVIASCIVDILQRQTGEKLVLPRVRTYLSALLAFNGEQNNISNEYISEQEQIIQIKSCLRSLNISNNIIDGIDFIPSNTNINSQEAITDFLSYPDQNNKHVSLLEELYVSDPDFHLAVDLAIPKRFRGEESRYKYVLFELYMILSISPHNKAGDMRENKYDTILQKFSSKLGVDRKDLPRNIYWKKDNLEEKYANFLQNKKEEKEENIRKKIRSIRFGILGAITLAFSLPGGGYWWGKTRSTYDENYAHMTNSHSKKMEMYNTYLSSMSSMKNMESISAQYSTPKNIYTEHNTLLLDSINFETSTLGTASRRTREAMKKNKQAVILRMTGECISDYATDFHKVNPSDQAVYKKMLEDIAMEYLNNRIFSDYEAFFHTVSNSQVLRDANNFLHYIASQTVSSSVPGHMRRSQTRVSEMLEDKKQGLQYVISTDFMTGIHYIGLGSHIPTGRENISTVCYLLADYSGGTLNIDEIEALYQKILKASEHEDIYNYYFLDDTLDQLLEKPDFLNIVRSDPKLKNLRGEELFSELACRSLGMIHRMTPSNKELNLKIHHQINADWKEKWKDNHSSMFLSRSIDTYLKEQYKSLSQSL